MNYKDLYNNTEFEKINLECKNINLKKQGSGNNQRIQTNVIFNS